MKRARVWACGCQSSKARGESHSRAHLSFSARSKGGDRPVEVDLPSWVSTPEFKASAEEKRARRAVRQEKGQLLEERLSWWLRG